ncbi:hypothetical protein [uncultured Clostridium sp.]|uniref:hypothetical protein n=1 Tax=uncultured Clostridium sp. TaxID=59620 RepID=UPI0025D33519|nr:hypothetical protein [uncultured Clostridium sp.]
MDIAEKLQLLEKSKQTLDALTVELRKRGYAKAMAERDYRKALARKEIELRGKGNNYPANLVYDIARGQESELRYKRDIAEIEYEVCRDRLRNERSSIEALRSLIAFDRVSYQNS